jgi:MoaA/NifB/PqqE/SkfB family radical SAM enzyme
MYKLNDIKDIHIEITSKCQARCPMCPRRINGGILNPLFTLGEIDIDTFKKWFSIEFVQQLDKILLCGNLGDPIIAHDCLEIVEYLRTTNSSMELIMHTNGSARTVEWWQHLAQYNIKVIFGIDGLSDTHALYRVGTDYDKIIENARAFINMGGYAEWHMLAFEHNEHQIAECKSISEQLGFKRFQLKHTSRFTGDKLHVLDDNGRTTHILRPTATSLSMVSQVQESVINASSISCKAKQYKQFYVAADGTLSPCCWLDFSWILPKQDSRIDYMDTVGIFPNLNKNTLEDIFSSDYFAQIEQTWNTKPLLECSRQCGNFDKCGEQFV